MRDTLDVLPPVIEQLKVLEGPGLLATNIFAAIEEILDEEIDSRHHAGPRRQLVLIAALALYGLRQAEEERP